MQDLPDPHYMAKASWLLKNHYPTPTKNPLELARLLEQKDNKRGH